MKIQYYVASLLDGFIATSADSLDWLFPRRVLSPTLRLTSVEKMGAGMVELRYDIRNRH